MEQRHQSRGRQLAGNHRALSDAALIRCLRSAAPDRPDAPPGEAVDAPQVLQELRRRHLSAMASYAGLWVQGSHAQILAAEAFRHSERGIGAFEPEDALRLQLLLTVAQTAERWAFTGRRAVLEPGFLRWLDHRALDDRRETEGAGYPPKASADSGSSLARWAVYTLPPRIRSLLWYTVIEPADTEDTAAVLGLTAVHPAARREDLLHRVRGAYLVHYTAQAGEACRNLIKLLEATTRPGTSAHRSDYLDRHLARCPDCSAAHHDLTRLFQQPDVLLAEALLPWAATAYLRARRTVRTAPRPPVRPARTAPPTRRGSREEPRRSARHARPATAHSSARTTVTITAMALLAVGAAAALTLAQQPAGTGTPPPVSPSPMRGETDPPAGGQGGLSDATACVSG
ncbi:hypothetical protein JK359_37440 [Streptomyces actinomycinicus]|uniref:Uncharacterized protein n=1 Tax=Streptomyces actinomycinicus TaxID=1695166 RepID=A0A937EQ89_9ACTN|nr:hypothetical protein [Streptomyces actinomycinicus]MBL1087558.1 hypothetical protein [Streptomyces actinomycinicus]